MNCRLCNYQTKEIFSNVILKKYNIKYYKCENCKLIQTESPYWLNKAYQDSISILDTGIFERNLRLSKLITVVLSLDFNFKKRFWNLGFLDNSKLYKRFENRLYDLGGGYGILVRLLRDIGIDAYWRDKYSKNLFARGFEFSERNAEAITAFELWEHYDNPYSEMEDIFKKYNPEILFVSTTLYDGEFPKSDWWYYSFETGQHICFYNQETMNYISKTYNYNLLLLSHDFIIFSKSKLNSELVFECFRNYKNIFEKIQFLYETKTYQDHGFLKKEIE